MDHLKISIITPSYNQGSYLEETILSVLNQNYENIEYIIIDGGSSDNSVEIIKKYQSKLHYWSSEKDNGQSEAINKGLKKCTGDVITWLNSDDVFLPNILSEVSNYFVKNPKLGLLHGKALLFGEKRKGQVIGNPMDHMKERYLAYIPFPQPSSFFNRKVIEKTGPLNANLHYGMDFDLLSRIALNFEITYINRILTKYRIHDESKTNHHLKFAEDWQKVFSKTLRSITDNTVSINILRKLNLYSEGVDSYDVSIIPVNFNLSLLYFLNTQMHYYYEVFEFKRVGEIAEQIKKVDQDFYYKEGVQKLEFRSKYLPKGIIKQMRKFTR